MPRKNQKSVTTYRVQEITNWRQTLDEIPSQINLSNEKIRENNIKLNAEYLASQQLNETKIQPTLAQIEKILAQINVVELPKKIDDIEQKIKSCDTQAEKIRIKLNAKIETIKLLNPEIEHIEKLISCAESQEELKKLVVRFSQEETELKNENRTLFNLQAQMTELQSRKNNLQAKLTRLITEKETWQAVGNNGYTSSQQNESTVVYNNVQSNNGYETSQSNAVSSPTNIIYDQMRAQREIEIAGLQREVQTLKSAIATLEQQQNKCNSIITRKKSAIKLIELDIQRYQTQIKKLQDEIGADAHATADLMHLRSKLEQKKLQKKPHDAEKNKLEKQIKDLNFEIRLYEDSLHQSQHALDKAKEIVRYLPERKDLESLRHELASYEERKTDLLNQKSHYDANIAALKKAIQNDQQRVERLTEQQKDLISNAFISQFLSAPNQLLQELIERTETNMVAYEQKHPAGQSPTTRLVLADIGKKIKLIQNEQPQLALYPNEFKDNADRVRYFQLSGLLFAMYDKAKDKDEELANAILSSLGNRALDPNEAKKEYIDFRDACYAHAEMSEAEEFVYSTENYHLASESIKQTLLQLETLYEQNGKNKKVRDFIDQGKNVWNLIQHKVNHASETGQTDFDLKFHINLLNKTNAVLQNSQDPKLNREYCELAAQSKDGKPSLCKKISGAMMMFAGAALAASSVILGIFGFFDPFEKPAIVGGVVAGVGLFSSGLALFRSGMKKDMALATERFSNSAKCAGLTFWQAPVVKAPEVKELPLPKQPETSKEHEHDDLQYGDFSRAYRPSAPGY